MKKDDLVSIIIPIYNVEKYLDVCMSSIVEQTYENIEIILVNDGSTDNSGRICDEWAKEDSRITVIHKENGGLSDARNAGIEVAKGKYFVFVDSDDFLDKTLVQYCYDIMQKNDVDIITYDCQFVNETGEIIGEKTKYITEEKMSGRELLCQFLSVRKCRIEVWSKFYKAEVWKSLRFPRGKIHEDEFVVLDVFLNAKEVIVTNKQLYYYRRRSGSIMSSRTIQAYYDELEALKLQCEKLRFDEEVYIYTLNRYYNWLITLYWAEQEKEKRTLIKKMYRQWSEFSLLFGWADLKHKLMYGSFFLSPYLYRFLDLLNGLRCKCLRKK